MSSVSKSSSYISSQPSLCSRMSTDPVFSTPKRKSLSVDEIAAFKAMLPDLIHELTYNGVHKNMPTVNKYLAEVCT